MPNRDRKEHAFTLVELLVVIAIIGVLVALLLPAIQAARESARRTQCKNQMKQMGLAVLNLEQSQGVFPSGGIYPHPRIEHFQQNGKPFGPKKQGLSWAFQILPYLEQGAIHNLSTDEQISEARVDLYFCPSQRAPIQAPADPGGDPDFLYARWLMDYAGVVPGPSRAFARKWGTDPSIYNNNILQQGCGTEFGFWGSISGNIHSGGLQSSDDLGEGFIPFMGVFVRGSYYVTKNDGTLQSPLNYGKLVTHSRIEDGSSNTAMITEKRIRTDKSGDLRVAEDDRGWSDGWDLDTLVFSLCQPHPSGVKQLQIIQD
ncbi:MAG: DUF1559 domain-containing protein, partial [Pirellulales bacterium]|nr:DUF1559 domain-containing protein [Pirellulales bacterium]